MDTLPYGFFSAPATNKLKSDIIKGYVLKTALDILENGGLEINNELLKNIEHESELCFGTGKDYISIHQYKNFIKRFDREKFISNFPSISSHIDSFCFKLRTKVSLAMNPDKILELVTYLSENNITELKPSIIKKVDKSKLYNWFVKNCRGEDGKVDWKLIHVKVNELYTCDFSYQESREKITKEFAINKSREILSEVIREKGFWYPADDLERLDKQIYIYLISLPEFRVEADRPDLELRGIKNTGTRPNWFIISKELGRKFSKTMRIGRGEGVRELEYRSLEGAIDELNDTIELEGFPYWGPYSLYNFNVNLFTWFKNHVRSKNGGINWEKIINHELVREEVKSKFN